MSGGSVLLAGNADAGRGRRPALGAALLLGLMASAWPTGPWAQTTTPQATSRPVPAAPSEDPDPAQDETENRVTEVVVTGRRAAEPGAVIGEIKPELQLSPAEIQSYGVSSVTELLTELAPQTRSGRGRGGEQPVVLLNGRRVSGFNEIRDLPVEAIQRVDILPEEAALKYGFSANQRVVNIVLRRRFRAVTAELSGGGPTAGGRGSGQIELDLLRIRDGGRLNLDLKVQGASGLTESERGLTPITAGSPFAFGGNVLGVGGGEIDPALSALAGRTVTLAPLPGAAGARRLTLADFAAAGGTANTSDTGAFRSLLPATGQVSANAVWSRAVLGGISTTLNGTLETSTRDSLQGLPGVSLAVPAGNPFSPFTRPLAVDRFALGVEPLRQRVEGVTAHLGGTVDRDLSGWRLSLTSGYDHADTRTTTDVGVSSALLQAQVNAGAIDPFASITAGQLNALAQNTARQRTDNANVQLVANGQLLTLPAGALFASIKAGDAQSWLSSKSQRFGVTQSVDLSRNDLSAQINLDAPITSRRKQVFEPVGDLSLNLNAAVETLSDFGVLTTLGYGLNWTPVVGLSLIASRTYDQNAPTIQQLGGPVIVTPGARILDFTTGRTIEVTRVDGGNRALIGDDRDVLKLGLNYKPLTGQDLTLQVNYTDSRITNPIASFPAATAEIEAAFPDRFVRDASGNLIQVDLRPVNLAREDRQELRYGFNYSRPFGPQPTRRFGPGAPRGPGGADGARGRGAAGGPGAPAGSGEAPRGQGDGAPRSSGGTGGAGRGGGGFGGGGGFPGGGPPGGGFGGGPPRGRLQFALYHTVHFKDELLVRSGGAVFDRLNGSAAGSLGGQPRHEVEAQAGLFINGIGARLSAEYRSGTFVRGGARSSTGDLNFSDLTTVSFRLFDNLGQQRDLVRRHPWLRGSRVGLAITNLFDQRVQVTDATGSTPLSYQPDFLDPLGRTIRVNFRKLFF